MLYFLLIKRREIIISKDIDGSLRKNRNIYMNLIETVCFGRILEFLVL